MDVSDYINESSKARSKMRFFYRDEEYDGIIVHRGHEVCILQEESDLEFDGYQVFLINEVSEVRFNGFDAVNNEIIQHNGEFEKVTGLNWFGCVDSYVEVLKVCCSSGIWPAVEINMGEGADFYIGEIKAAKERKFTMHSYDAMGVWEDESVFDYSDVVRLEFDSRYINHFNNFMKAQSDE